MDLELRGKLALVTGATQGIGRATAMMLAKEGCDLVLVARDPVALAHTLLETEKMGAKTKAIAAELGSPAEIQRVADTIGGIDILVNNAGAIPGGSLQDVSDESWRAGWDVKVHGYINMCRSLYPALAARRGVVINIIGAASDYLLPQYLAGSSGNAALVAFTRAFARGARRDGIRAVGINPGAVATDRYVTWMRDRAQRELGDAERWEELVQALPFGRAGLPDEIASAVCFLASPRSGYTSGTILTIDGAAT